MDEYKLIELCRREGAKNIICQLLDPGQIISLNKVEETRSYVVAIDGGARYCLTGNPNIFDPLAQYIILTDHTPTKQKLLDGTVKQKKWLLHPKMSE